MAAEVRSFSATIPAGTPKAAPVNVAIAMPVRIVTQVDWRVPDGPSGLFGWLLAMGGVPVQPQPAGTFIVANNQSGIWHLVGAPDSGAWQVRGYNTGTSPHTVYLDFHCELPERAPAMLPLLTAYELGPAPDLSRAGPPVPGRLWRC